MTLLNEYALKDKVSRSSSPYIHTEDSLDFQRGGRSVRQPISSLGLDGGMGSFVGNVNISCEEGRTCYSNDSRYSRVLVPLKSDRRSVVPCVRSSEEKIELKSHSNVRQFFLSLKSVMESPVGFVASLGAVVILLGLSPMVVFSDDAETTSHTQVSLQSPSGLQPEQTSVYAGDTEKMNTAVHAR